METSSEKRSHAGVFGIIRKSDFSSWNAFKRSSTFGWILFALAAFVLTSLLLFQVDTLPATVHIGALASRDIRADQNYEIQDSKATAARREQAKNDSPIVLDYNENYASSAEAKIQRVFYSGREFISADESGRFQDFKKQMEEDLGVPISEEELRALLTSRFDPVLELVLRETLFQVLSSPVVYKKSDLPLLDRPVLVRHLRGADVSSEGLETLNIKSIDEARREFIALLFQKSQHEGEVVLSTLERFLPIANRLIQANLTYNVTETNLRRERAEKNEKPVIIQIKPGETIVRAGELYTAQHQTILEGIRQQKTRTNFKVKFLATFLFLAVVLLVLYSFAARYLKRFRPNRIDLIFLGANLFFVLLFVRLIAAIGGAFKDSLSFKVEEMDSFYFMMPVAAGAMLTRLILNSEIALVFAVVASAFSAFFLEADVPLFLFFLISSLVGAGAIAYADRRSAILKAGVFTGLLNGLAILILKLLQVFSVSPQWDQSLLLNLAAGFLGGTNSALYVLFYTPICEMLFKYTTDIKLLELGSLNHPLMKEMIVKAPGTYHHSQLVAVLSEAAAEAIGANPILARVGAYFHDIGKMAKPLYFIENQQGGENRHDHLTPSMSALVISSHVKDGIEMAENHQLPQAIIDMIPQHQGTKIMHFFYNKAKEEAAKTGSTINESDYRYEGPRPQTREAGILLLADSVEAAVRSLPEKTPAKIESMVHKIVNRNFVEEQLDECDLALKDLKTLTDSFVRVLIGIYHQRIAYPEMQTPQGVVVPIASSRS